MNPYTVNCNNDRPFSLPAVHEVDSVNGNGNKKLRKRKQKLKNLKLKLKEKFG